MPVLPPTSFPWKTALKIAWRESRAASAKFLFVVFAVALGVASLTGVRSFSEAFERMLLAQARVLMAADLTVRVFEQPDAAQQEVFDELAKEGVAETWITETVTMASSPHSPDPVLASVKAVDPARYPFYGEVKLSPPGRLADVLTPETVVAANDVLLRLDVQPGDTIRIGGVDFRLAAAVTFEPDRMTGSLNVGPRIMISRAALARTGLLQPGSRAAQRFLFKLPTNGMGVAALNRQLKKVFPGALIADFREAHPAVQRGLERSTTFLSLVSLIALIVGALGVATAVHSHLQQKLDIIAVMKCLGARSHQVIRIYALQAGLLGLAGSLAGILGGLAVQKIFPILIARYFPLQPTFTVDGAVLASGLIVGLLTTLLFTVPPLLDIRRIRPGSLLRRAMPEARRIWWRRGRELLAPALAGLAILAGIGGISGWIGGSGAVGAYFVGGLTGSLLVLSLVAFGLLWLLRAFVTRGPWKLAPTVRHGLANLYRPGSQGVAILVGLGVGVMFTQTVYLVQHSMLADIMKSAPAGMPNVFLINITKDQREGIADLLEAQPGVDGRPELVPSVTARLTSINGREIDRENLRGRSRRFRGAQSVNWAATKPEDVEILDGSWWTAETIEKENWAAVNDRTADDLRIHPGMTLEWTVGGLPVQAKVACVYKRETVGIGSNVEFILNERALRGMPVLYWAAAKVEPPAVASLIRASYRKYPAVTVINAADVFAIVQEVVDQVALVVRFISVFAILAGAVILASSVAGTRFRRVREVVILKTLGATRWQVAQIFSVEFLVLGAVAGLMGGLLASGFSAVILKRLFQSTYTFEWWPTLLCVALTALVANLAGWAASFRILDQKPLEILRNE